MSDTTTPAAPAKAPPARSLGLKLLLVCGLALLMTIPALFVFALLGDRTSRAEQVAAEIGGLVGGPQTFLGPVIGVPYLTPAPPVREASGAFTPQPPTQSTYVIFPDDGSATVRTRSDIRRRSLFDVPIYEADLSFRGRFDLTGSPENAPANATFDWSRAEFLIGVSDPRGAKSDVVLSAAGRRLPLAPAASLQQQALRKDRRGPAGEDAGLRFFGASAAGVGQPGAVFDAALSLRFSGAERIAVLPFGKTTAASVQGAGRPGVSVSPSFDGGFLPTRRALNGDGFSASWEVPFIARGVPAEGDVALIADLGSASLGVSFVEAANPYQSVARSLKYAPLFLGLVFLTYFLFEVVSGRRVHPAQYVLVGLAQIIFYLLLLAIAEQIGFDAGFLLAAVATVGLISVYAGWTFDSRTQGLRALVVFALLYVGIYVLMRLEDYALLVGAVASFIAIAAVMWFTRRIDWYGMTESSTPKRAKSAGPVPPTTFSPTPSA